MTGQLFDRSLLPDLRVRLIGATQALLGDTIGLAEDEWQYPSGLPGWARAHVVCHLAQQADRTVALAERLLRGERYLTWPIDEPDHDLEPLSRRRAVELQVSLDTSSGRLLETFDKLAEADWQAHLTTPLGSLPAVALAYARLNEVILHHIDLRLGLTLTDLDVRVAAWLLEWNAERLNDRLRHCQVHLLADEGADLVVGTGAPCAEVRGATSSLLGWLTGRLGPEAVLGAEAVDLGGPL
ncbi:MAG: maleylpyruvate isomerase family mycothiol-dependent enzyme [Propionibacteriaceae bacterium]|jgi:maleylpyruvate isomerase|nr:maleylpyruvate isomerase family mycothiol-dependent enzyme [Propionibacteriaceae bacterium]